MGLNRHKYIHDLAKTLQGQLKILPGQFRDSDELPQQLLKRHSKEIFNLIGRWSDETKGKVAACGRPEDCRGTVSVVQVIGNGLDYNLKHGGELILVLLAQGAIVAAIVDNFRKHWRSSPDDQCRPSMAMTV